MIKCSNIRFVLLLLLLITFDPVTGLILINQKSQQHRVWNNLPSHYLGGSTVTKTKATFVNRQQCLATTCIRNTKRTKIVSTLILNEKLNNDNDNDSNNNNMNPLTKSTWYAAEVFGNVVGFIKNKQKQQKGDNNIETTTTIGSNSIDLSIPPKTIDETIQRIQDDNSREYFLSGTVDTLIYDVDCTFADPFVSFNGRDRFVTNLANLGSVITKYSAKPINKVSATSMRDKVPTTTTPSEVYSKFMVKLELNLPWRPVLAWPWGVRCVIDPSTNLIVLHEESWDIDPWEGVKQVFRKPTTKL